MRQHRLAQPLTGLGAIAISIIAAFFLSRPPSPDDAATAFSALRARAAIAALNPQGRPHPTGSEENRLVRDRLVAELRKLGLEPRVDRRFVCSERAACADVENVIARSGPASGKAILLATHYDSVGAGPGASDAGMGYGTILEIARITRGESLRHPIVFLFTDGEEAGLLGARAFAASPELRDVAVAIEIEARGTKGPSLMFETGRGDLPLMRIFDRGVERPFTSSLFVAIYRMLPNDTDFTVFREAGLTGYNFANIGAVTRYHTRNDSLRFLDLRTLQHHGDNVLGLTRALQQLKALPSGGGSDGVFTDILGRTLVVWSPLANAIAPVVLLLLTIGAIALAVSRKRAGALGVIGRAFFPLATAVAAALLTFAAIAALQWHGAIGESPFLADPRPAIATTWLIALFVVTLFSLIRPFHETLQFHLALALLWSVLSLLLAFVLPGATYAALLPAVAAFLAALVSFRSTDGGRITASLIATVLPLLLLAPTLLVLPDAMGVPMLPAVSALAALTMTGAMPLLGAGTRNDAAGVMLVLSIVLLFSMAVAFSREPYDEANPRRSNLILLQSAATGTTRLVATSTEPTLTRGLAGTRRFGPRARPFEWSRARGFVATLKSERLAPPAVTLLADEPRGAQRRLRLHVRSARGASALRISAKSASAPLLEIHGMRLPLWRPKESDLWSGDYLTLPAEGVAVTLTVDASTQLWIGDLQRGVPSELAHLARLRDSEASASDFWGDYSMVGVRVK